MISWYTGVVFMKSVRSVSINPGARAFTWMLKGADADDFKPTLVKGANFVGFLKPFENNCRVDHCFSLLCDLSFLNLFS